MSVASEITRLQSAKAALKTAINSKNDSSHQIDDETLEDYAGFVDLIHDALPAAYTELEYIESSGTQYINTGIGPTVAKGTEIYLKMAYVTATTRNTMGANSNLVVSVQSNKWKLNGVVTSVPVVANEVVEFVLQQTSSGRYYSINNENGYGTSNETSNNFFLGSLGGASSYTMAAKFYKCTIKENGITVRNLIPAKRNSDNAIGIYDKVSGTFFTNAGTGEFIAPSGSSSATLITKTITENGTYDASDDSADGYSEVTVNVQPPQEAESKDVNFYDYDGRIVYSYTAADFQNLTELPANPTHSGLTAQGWNWTLADAKAQVTAVGACDIGQMYVTSDGKTRLYCHFTNEMKSFYLSLCPNGTLIIDWGDGSSTDTVTGSSRTTVVDTQHTYANSGNYVITITVSSGNFAFYGGSTQSYLLRKATNDTANIHLANLGCLDKVEVGTNCYLGNYSFNRCFNLKTITLPSSLPALGTYCFIYCIGIEYITIPTRESSPLTTLSNDLLRYAYGFSSISIPKCITTIGADTFRAAYNLSRIVISNGITTLNSTNAFYACWGLREAYISTAVTSIKGSTFNQCYSLSKLVIPASVTTIATKAFSDCYGMKEYHFKSATPPTLDNVDAFDNIQSDCVIYVPSASLNTYKTASNWSTYASQMVGE